MARSRQAVASRSSRTKARPRQPAAEPPPPPPPPPPEPDLEQMEIEELQAMAKGLEIADAEDLEKDDLMAKIRASQGEAEGAAEGEAEAEPMRGRGVLEVLAEGFGFARARGFLPGPQDMYVSQSQIKRFGLKTGDLIEGQVRPPKSNERYYSLLKVEQVNALEPETAKGRRPFEELTPIYPTERLRLESAPKNISGRFIDLIAPIGKGQRGLIVSPPKAGKTTILKVIANSVTANHPEVVLMVLLIDERPEEVTDIERSVKGEVIASTFDEMPENHMRAQEMTLERAKRMVEQGKDVLVLLDSITRLSRASNLTVTPSGRTLSGGLDPSALYRPKRFLGAARNIENGGSLTIIGTALIDTGSRMDEAIFEEFKATGNMELQLDRGLSERRLFPAFDIKKSGTRHEELLMDEDELRRVWRLRRVLNALDAAQATELVLTGLNKTNTNKDFLNLVEKELRPDAK